MGKEIAVAAEAVSGAGEAVTKSEEGVNKKHEDGTKATAMIQHVADVEGLVKEAKDQIVAAREAIKKLDAEKVDPDLKKFCEVEIKKLETTTTNQDTRVTKVETGLKKVR